MKVSLNWLKDYVALPSDVDIAHLSHVLTMSTVEVEGVDRLGEALANIKVGRILSVADIPASHNKHVVCDVGSGRSLSIVCGASGLAEGMLVPVALPGARIRPYGREEMLEVGERKIAGVASQAVICAASEIGLTELFPPKDEKSIADISELGSAPGTDLAAAIGWDDEVLEIDNKSLTHRPDLWGHYGIARELSAILRLPLNPLPAMPQSLPSADLVGSLDEDCDRFSATRFSNVRIGQAPFWMRSRLSRVGQRPLNSMVDITNYVMLAVGQPTHAFDTARIATPIGVRKGRPDETLELIDGKVVPVDGLMVVCDRNGAISLAGVMGGAGSAVLDTSTDIILEIAAFDAASVRRTATKLSKRTEASSRFEKAIDTQRVDQALQLFLHLNAECHPGSQVTGHMERHPRPTKRKHIDVKPQFIRDHLGKDIDAAEMKTELERIGFEVEATDANLSLTVPTWRSTGDIAIPHDIVEEIARLYGYDHFTFVPPITRLEQPSINRQVLLDRHIREYLAFSGGMQEVVNYPWTDDYLLRAAGVERRELFTLAAAPAPDQTSLRPSLIPSLLRSVALNRRHFETFRLFEAGAIFEIGQGHADRPSMERGLGEEHHIGGALAGTDPEALFFQAKGLLEAMPRALHFAPYTFAPGEAPGWAMAGTYLAILLGGRSIGGIGILGNRAMTEAGIRRSHVVLFEIDVDSLRVLPSRDNGFTPLPEFPAIELDLSVLVADSVAWTSLDGAVRGLDPLIGDVSFVDQFRGKGVPEGSKSLTLRLKLSAADRTLTGDEAKEIAARVSATLASRFGAIQRG